MKLRTNLMLILSMLALLIGAFSGCANTPITEESVLEVPANPEVDDSDHADIISSVIHLYLLSKFVSPS